LTNPFFIRELEGKKHCCGSEKPKPQEDYAWRPNTDSPKRA